jgi:hypothetical protein
MKQTTDPIASPVPLESLGRINLMRSRARNRRTACGSLAVTPSKAHKFQRLPQFSCELAGRHRKQPTHPAYEFEMRVTNMRWTSCAYVVHFGTPPGGRGGGCAHQPPVVPRVTSMPIAGRVSVAWRLPLSDPSRAVARTANPVS